MDSQTRTALGLCIVGGIVYLGFVNWQAAVLVCLLLIMANLANLAKVIKEKTWP